MPWHAILDQMKVNALESVADSVIGSEEVNQILNSIEDPAEINGEIVDIDSELSSLLTESRKDSLLKKSRSVEVIYPESEWRSESLRVYKAANGQFKDLWVNEAAQEYTAFLVPNTLDSDSKLISVMKSNYELIKDASHVSPVAEIEEEVKLNDSEWSSKRALKTSYNLTSVPWSEAEEDPRLEQFEEDVIKAREEVRGMIERYVFTCADRRDFYPYDEILTDKWKDHYGVDPVTGEVCLYDLGEPRLE